MSSKHYQHQWIQHALDLSHPLTSHESLSESEYEHLARWHKDKEQRSRLLKEVTTHLHKQIPLSLRNLLPQTFLDDYLQLFLKSNKPAELLLHMLSQQTLNTDCLGSQHFADICRYEMVQKDLHFYQLPKPLPAHKGPVLAEWARVIYLGPYFKLVLDALIKGHTVEALAATPLQPYLLLQEFKGIQLIGLEPLLAKCLESCTGESPWVTIVEGVLSQHSEARANSARESLIRAETHYLQEGVLLRPSVNYSEAL